MYRDYKYRITYLMPIVEETLKIMNDSRIVAACNRTSCIFFVQNRICSRKICGRILRCCIFEVRGSSLMDIHRFNRLLETYFPAYKQRKEHDAKAVKARIVFNEWTPDNSNLFYMGQRFGMGRSSLPDMALNGPCGGLLNDWATYHTGLMDMVADIPRNPWMASKRENDGLYCTSYGNSIGFRPMLLRPSNKNRTFKGRESFEMTTEPLPKMNYFSAPEYLDRLIDPLRVETQRAREAMLEAERHSNKTMMPGHQAPAKSPAAAAADSSEKISKNK